MTNSSAYDPYLNRAAVYPNSISSPAPVVIAGSVSGTAADKAMPGKKRVWPFVLLTLLGIVLIAGSLSAALLVARSGAMDLMKEYNKTFDYRDYADEAPVIYEGALPHLAAVSVAEGTDPIPSREIFKKIYKGVVQIYQYNENAIEENGIGYGSGFIVTSDGFIITNAHVLDNPGSVIKVTMYDGTEHDALLVAADEKDDIGVIKIDGEGFDYIELGDSSMLSEGDRVYTVGNPDGPELVNSFCNGIVSGLNRTINMGTVNDLTFIQTNAEINPGNSGGPLINEFGQAVGINSGKNYGVGYDNICFSLPMHLVLPVIDQLFQYGYVPGRVTIGATVVDFNKFEALKVKNGEAGVMIIAANEDSDLADSDFKSGDVITHINGVKVDSMYELNRQLLNYKPGDRVTLRIISINDDNEVDDSGSVEITLKEYLDKFRLKDLDNSNV
ncbi:MAG: trypsin-like peptidase domain-containing protein [Clostridia bacterium]|nr:trypsin-like peptidase domain-containing protein [Clostridia bacterium]